MEADLFSFSWEVKEIVKLLGLKFFGIDILLL